MWQRSLRGVSLLTHHGDPPSAQKPYFRMDHSNGGGSLATSRSWGGYSGFQSRSCIADLRQTPRALGSLRNDPPICLVRRSRNGSHPHKVSITPTASRVTLTLGKADQVW